MKEKSYKFGAEKLSYTASLKPGRYLVSSDTGAMMFVLNETGWHRERGKSVVKRPSRPSDGTINTYGYYDPYKSRAVWRV